MINRGFRAAALTAFCNPSISRGNSSRIAPVGSVPISTGPTCIRRVFSTGCPSCSSFSRNTSRRASAMVTSYHALSPCFARVRRSPVVI